MSEQRGVSSQVLDLCASAGAVCVTHPSTTTSPATIYMYTRYTRNYTPGTRNALVVPCRPQRWLYKRWLQEMAASELLEGIAVDTRHALLDIPWVALDCSPARAHSLLGLPVADCRGLQMRVALAACLRVRVIVVRVRLVRRCLRERGPMHGLGGGLQAAGSTRRGVGCSGGGRAARSAQGLIIMRCCPHARRRLWVMSCCPHGRRRLWTVLLLRRRGRVHKG